MNKLKDFALGFVAFILVAGSALVGVAFAQSPMQPTCDPSYNGGICIPPKPPDLDCIEISERNIQVVGNDPHDLDRDSDGIGCEAPAGAIMPTEPTAEPAPPVEEPTAEPVPVEPVPTPETPPVIPQENETQTPEPEPEPEPTPEAEVPIEGNITVPVENETTAEPEPLPPVTNETVPIEGNMTVPETPVVNETTPSGNETVELTPVPPVEAGNETVPIEGNVTVPVENETTTEPEPLPPITENETVPIEGNVTIGGGENETTTEEPAINVTTPQEPAVEAPEAVGNETGTEAAGNATETIPVEGNVTVPANATTTENATIDIERTPAEGENLNATQVFDNVVNASAILDERLNEAGDDANETERADIKAALGEAVAAMGDTSALIINATNDQLFSIQDIGNSVSEAIDVVTDDGDGGE